jgi:hypothetical protein
MGFMGFMGLMGALQLSTFNFQLSIFNFQFFHGNCRRSLVSQECISWYAEVCSVCEVVAKVSVSGAGPYWSGKIIMRLVPW